MPREEEMVHDERFSSMHSSQTFRKLPKKSKAIKLDSRFKGVLTDDKFRVAPGKTDKYGRKQKAKRADAELEEFYTIEDDDRDDDDDNDDDGDDDESIDNQQDKVAVKNAKKSGDKDKDGDMETRMEYLSRLARGEIDESSSDDSDEDDEDDEDDENDEDDDEDDDDDPEVAAEDSDDEGEAIEMGEESSRRIALQNCDWENVRAEDILVLLQSACPTGKTVNSVTVYLSDFGKEKMENEAKFGPQALMRTKRIDSNQNDDDEADSDEVDEDESDDDSNNHQRGAKSKMKGDFSRAKGHVGIVMQDDTTRGKSKAKLASKSSGDIDDNDDNEKKQAIREYELSKLKYYFAVAECDTVGTAEVLYSELDGVEFGHSGMIIDMRFIPDDISFDGREIRDTSKENQNNTILEAYKPPEFAVQALQHTNVECTWDQGEKQREKLLTNVSAWRQLHDSDLQQYLATSDSEDEGSDDDGKAASLRKLLLGDNTEVSDDDDDDGGRGARNGKTSKDDFFADDGDQDDAGSDDDDSEASDDDDNDDNDDNDDQEEEEDDDEDEDEDDMYDNDSEDPYEGMDVPDDEDGDDDNGEGNMSLTYIPEASKSSLKGGDDKNLTPFEAMQQKLAEKKKAKKMAKKERAEEEKKRQEAEAAEMKKQKAAKKRAGGKKDNADDTSDADDGFDELENDFDMRDIQKAEKLSSKKGKLSRRARRELKELADKNKAASSFKMDLKDDRFGALLEGDARFGIDLTAPEYKETSAMKEILGEQRKRRERESVGEGDKNRQSKKKKLTGAHSAGGGHGEEGDVDAVDANKGSNTTQAKNLADKLKRKFSKS
jgi:hypothetical protein